MLDPHTARMGVFLLTSLEKDRRVDPAGQRVAVGTNPAALGAGVQLANIVRREVGHLSALILSTPCLYQRDPPIPIPFVI